MVAWHTAEWRRVGHRVEGAGGGSVPASDQRRRRGPPQASPWSGALPKSVAGVNSALQHSHMCSWGGCDDTAGARTARTAPPSLEAGLALSLRHRHSPSLLLPGPRHLACCPWHAAPVPCLLLWLYSLFLCLCVPIFIFGKDTSYVMSDQDHLWKDPISK